jgi:hypothetical protein
VDTAVVTVVDEATEVEAAAAVVEEAAAEEKTQNVPSTSVTFLGTLVKRS